MNLYEKLLDVSYQENVDVVEYEFESERIKGLYCNGSVALSKALDSNAERACILAEELGHFHTSCGNILNMQDIASRKQERTARLWAYDQLVGLYGIVSAYESGCQNTADAAEYLGVTEEFFRETVECYHSKFGVMVNFDNYVIYFEPAIAVLKLR